jgi:DNA-binding transcriptional LysR family regulator
MQFELNLKQLRLFYHVARNLSFTKAAQEMFITQPAVQMQVTNLERQYGVLLFERKNRKITLTEAGASLYSYARQIMTLAFEAEQMLMNLKEHPCGILRLGTTQTWARYLMPTYVLLFQKRFPEIRIQLAEGSSEEMAASVVQGVNDVAIVGRVPYVDALEAMPFPGHERDELMVTVSPRHRLAARSAIDLAELRGEPMILRERGAGTRQVVTQYFEERGFSPTVLLEAASAPFIKDLVAKGAGVSILTKVSLEESIRSGALKGISLEGGGLFLPIDIVFQRRGSRAPAARAFLDFLLEQSQSWREAPASPASPNRIAPPPKVRRRR